MISPGSRSTPLTVAAHRLDGLPTAIHLDERSAAFAALGEAKVSGQPVILICSSGTAGANYHPAVAEAHQSGVALVVITADRPPEHHGWGVGQTFPQHGLFGDHVVATVNMPVGGAGGIEHAVRAGWQATSIAIEQGGPVHVNWPFRLPVEPAADAPPPTVPASLREASAIRVAPSHADVVALEDLAGHSTGVIIAGPYAVLGGDGGNQTRDAIWSFASRTGWPILADVLSGLRGAPPDVPIVDVPDLVARANGLLTPDVILRLGDTPTAKSLMLWWQSLPDTQQVYADPRGRWHDPSHTATDRLRGDLALLLEAVSVTNPNTDWTDRWRQLGVDARNAVQDNIQTEEWTEAQIAAAVTNHPAVTDVFASSSMPIRDLDTIGSSNWSAVVHANRGVNGIDGVVSAAIGAARASGTRQTVFIGDVAILHDLGGVFDAVRQGVDLTIIVPNNNGGGIFSHLPIRSVLDDAEYETLFHTPHDTNFSFFDAVDGITFTRADRESLPQSIDDAADRPGVSIIECPVLTADSVAHLHALTAAVRAALP